jgi:hypothetical protein
MSWIDYRDAGDDPGGDEIPFVPGYLCTGDDVRIISTHPLELKVCDCCGSPNLQESRECVICRWRGHFSGIETHDPLALRETWPVEETSSSPAWIRGLKRSASRFWDWLLGR